MGVREKVIFHSKTPWGFGSFEILLLVTKKINGVCEKEMNQLNAQQIASATGLCRRTVLPSVLRQLKAYLPPTLGPDGEERFAVYHKSLTEWLTDAKMLGELYSIDPVLGHEQIADWCWSEYENTPASMGPYTTTYASRHLVACQRWDEVVQLLDDPLYLEHRSPLEHQGPHLIDWRVRGASVGSVADDIFHCFRVAPDGVMRSHQTGFVEALSLLVVSAKQLIFDGMTSYQHADRGMLRLKVLFEAIARTELDNEDVSALYRGYMSAFPSLNKLMKSGYLHDAGNAADSYAADMSRCAKGVIERKFIKDDDLRAWLEAVAEADPLGEAHAVNEPGPQRQPRPHQGTD